MITAKEARDWTERGIAAKREIDLEAIEGAIHAAACQGEGFVVLTLNIKPYESILLTNGYSILYSDNMGTLSCTLITWILELKSPGVENDA